MIKHRFSILLLLAPLVFLFIFLFPGCTTVEEPIRIVKPGSQSINSNSIPDFAELVEKVKTSVVAITTESVTYDSLNHPVTEAGAGSGWVVTEDGLIVTNNHVVGGAENITVEFCDHRAYPASIIQTDPVADLAVIRVLRGETCQPLTIADTSTLKVGQWVLVLGNPLGLGISVKQGIISRLNVTMSSSPEQVYYNLIETSAAINPGNSGGPMVNMNGEVIGITSLKIDATGVEGMGYAITIGDVLPVIRTLAEGKKYVRPWLGTSIISVDQGIQSVYKLSSSSGVLIIDVSTGSPADKAGLKRGDVITSFNHEPVASAQDIHRLLSLCSINQEVAIEYWRGSELHSCKAVLTEAPSPNVSAETSIRQITESGDSAQTSGQMILNPDFIFLLSA